MIVFTIPTNPIYYGNADQADIDRFTALAMQRMTAYAEKNWPGFTVNITLSPEHGQIVDQNRYSNWAESIVLDDLQHHYDAHWRDWLPDATGG